MRAMEIAMVWICCRCPMSHVAVVKRDVAAEMVMVTAVGIRFLFVECL